jgi:hypothetical protein
MRIPANLEAPASIFYVKPEVALSSRLSRRRIRLPRHQKEVGTSRGSSLHLDINPKMNGCVVRKLIGGDGLISSLIIQPSQETDGAAANSNGRGITRSISPPVLLPDQASAGKAICEIDVCVGGTINPGG